MEQNTISYWNKTAEKTQYPKLTENLKTEVLIVGAGITGISCAYNLAEKGLSPVVIEAGALCDGTTGNTTGKLTIQHNVIYTNLIKKYGEDFAGEYAKSQTEAIDFVRKVVRLHSIDCALAESEAFIYSSAECDRAAIEAEYEAAKKLGIDAEFIDKPEFPKGNFGMLGFKNQAVFHSVRYVEALAKLAVSKGVRIYCETKAVKVEPGEGITVLCENGIEIKANHLVMATQYPIYDGPNLFYTRLYATRDYGIAVRAKKPWPDGSYINNGEPARSIRTHMEQGNPILIVVGESHFTGRGEDDMSLHHDRLVQFAESIAGVEEVLAKWSAQDYETPDQVPYIGRISNDLNIYAASGFGKWGLSNGTLAGRMIAQLIAEGRCRYEEIYSRNRADYTSSLGKTLTEVFGSVGELIKSKFEPTEGCSGLQQGEGRVINFEGQKAGIYRDFDDIVTILDISCTHMSTELNFNSAEKTWDCPAHGGRYGTDGKLLEGPPKNPLKVLFRGTFSELARSE